MMRRYQVDFAPFLATVGEKTVSESAARACLTPPRGSAMLRAPCRSNTRAMGIRFLEEGALDGAGGATVIEEEPPPADAGESEPAPTPPPELSEGEVERRSRGALVRVARSVERLASLEPAQRRARERKSSAALGALGVRLASSGLPYELRAIAGGWQIFTHRRHGRYGRSAAEGAARRKGLARGARDAPRWSRTASP
jgi:hypothetical protein